MASSPSHATPSEPTAEPTGLDRLQRAVAGWVGPVVYALPILEVWLLSRMGESGANALLVALQVGWALCLVVVLVICGRRWRAPEPVAGTLIALAEADERAAAATTDGSAERPSRPSARPIAGDRDAHKLAPPASPARRTASSRPRPRRRGEH